jgi:hypothetical protein
LDGSVFIADQSNKRVLEYNAWGEFTRTFGGGVVFGGAEGTGTLTAGSTEVESVITTGSAFLAGEAISGEGIRAKTKIVAVNSGVGAASKLVLSRTATESKSGVVLSVTASPGNVSTNELQTISVPAAASGSYVLKFTTTSPTAEATTGSIAVGASAEGSGSVQEALGALSNLGAANVGVSGPAIGGSGQSIYTVEFKGTRFADTNVEALAVAGQPSGGNVTIATPRQGASGAETCNAIADCKAGLEGTGRGQFGQVGSVQGVAIDSAGGVYVVDRPNRRVQKLDPEGHFVWTLGKKVNKTAVAEARSGEEDLCPAPGHPADECQAGEEGSGASQFGAWTVLGSYIAVDTNSTATAADDKLYIGDKERIHRCDTNGQSCVILPDPEGLLSAKKVASLAVVPSGSGAPDAGRLFVVRESSTNFFGLNATTGVKECEGTTAAPPKAVAADSVGNAYLIEGALGRPVRKFNPSCTEVTEETTSPPFFPTFPFTPGFSDSTGIALGQACWNSPHYALYLSNSVEAVNGALVNAYGPAPEKEEVCHRIPHAPQIEAQSSLSVETDRATVQATINPKQRADTTYFVQYGTAACIEAEPEGWEAGCVERKPTSPALLGAGAIDFGAKTAKVLLAGLTPGTEYLYRFVAESSGGGPVYGAGGTEEDPEGKAALFTTATSPPLPDAGCPNQSLRYGASAFLPDCRAYEMVSPVNKNGGEIRPGKDAYFRVSPDGSKITYDAEPVFGDQPGNKVQNQYIASREEAGGNRGDWASQGINAPLGEQITVGGLNYPTTEVLAFSPDLCSEWLLDYNVVPLTADGHENYVNLYRQDLCRAGGFEALVKTAPNGLGEAGVAYLDADAVQGFSAGLAHILVVAKAGLTPDAVQGATVSQVYDYVEGVPHLVSVLPDGSADPGSVSGGGAAAGGGAFQTFGGNVATAISADGSRVFWTSGLQIGGLGANRVYLRLNPAQPESARLHGAASGSGDLLEDSATIESVVADTGAFAVGQEISGQGIPAGATVLAVDGTQHTLTLSAPASETSVGSHLSATSECTEPDEACTVPVSNSFPSNFWSATPDGSAVLFSEGSLGEEDGKATLYRFDVETAARTVVAQHVVGVLGASRDLSRIYYISTDALTPGETNGAGDEAQAGEPNLYLDEEGDITFIGTLLGGPTGDVAGGVEREKGPSETYRLGSFNPRYNAARVTPDGGRIVFESRARLTGFDNTDAGNGEADVEVFTYEANGAMHCVSCKATGAGPNGGELTPALTYPQGGDTTGIWAAAWVPGAQHPLHSSNLISQSGERFFFLSFTPLVGRDTNGVQDVYEWEAPGEGGCKQESPAFHAANGGCIYLISTGESPFESEFWEASPDGRDVFITTESSLVPQDPGSIDLYDAREGGGFLQSPEKVICEGEACQLPPSSPNDATPGSSSFDTSETRPPCPKGKVRHHRRCIARHPRKHKRHPRPRRPVKHDRRAAR